jgi:hypothetical protein
MLLCKCFQKRISRVSEKGTANIDIIYVTEKKIGEKVDKDG